MAHPHPPDTRPEALASRRGRADRPFPALCYAPFAQLSFDPTGAVSVCCLSRHEPIGNVTDASLGELWRGEGIRVVREALRRDAWPTHCATCQWEFEHGNVENHPALDFDGVPLTPGLQWPTRLEFALSNQCNLACIHCRPGLSSTIERQRGLPPSPRVYGDRFFAELAEFLPHTTHLSFLGGEPFLQDECHRIWEMLLEQRLRPGVFVTTNGTVWNPRVERLLERLPMHFAVSLDGATPETIRAVRVHAQPEAVRRNIDRFRELARRQLGGTVPEHGYLISLNFALMRRNWKETGDFFLLAEELACRIWATPVRSPRERSLFTLPARAQRAIADALHRQTGRVLPQLHRNAEVWKGLVAMVESEAQQAELAEQRRAMPDAWDAMRRGAEEEAYHHAARTRPDDPNYLASLLLRASLLTTHGHLALAEQVVDEAGRLAPDHHELLLRRGWLRHRQNRVPEGLADASRLAERLAGAPVDAPWITHGVHSLRANLLAAAGDRAGALAAIDTLLALDPGNAEARAFRTRLTGG